MHSSSPGQPPERLAYKWKVLIAVIFGVFMVVLDTTVVNVAFRALQQEFGASIDDSQWIISIYVLSLGSTTPLAGFLADRFGIKRLYLSGLVIFVLGSALCGLAPSLWLLVAARALQGFGGGLVLPLGLPQIYRAFPREEQGMALGFWASRWWSARRWARSLAAGWLTRTPGAGSSLSMCRSGCWAFRWRSAFCASTAASGGPASTFWAC